MFELEKNRDCVIAIQGGGVYGLSLLGQVQAVIEEHAYNPLAFAGTSAGAIVATLLWVGLEPSKIRDHFVAMSDNDSNALLELLGPFNPAEFISKHSALSKTDWEGS